MKVSSTLALALTFVIGCKKAMSFGPFRDDKGTFMQDLLGVNPRAVIEEITQVRCGWGSNIELANDTMYVAAGQFGVFQRALGTPSLKP